MEPKADGDDAVLASTKKIPLLTVKAGPRDGEEWSKRLKEEYKSLIEYVKMNKEAGTDWFKVSCVVSLCFVCPSAYTRVSCSITLTHIRIYISLKQTRLARDGPASVG